MAEITDTASYVIHSDEEPRRLDRQAAIYGTEDDLRHAAIRPGDRVLDAGCGSGSAARLFARSCPGATVLGVDRNAQYLDYASRQAAAEGLANVRFQAGDVLALPLADAQFDIVWSKHLLQWVGQREQALREFIRVTRPGGRIIACNFDGFGLQMFPEDPEVQALLDTWFGEGQRQLGFDNWLGRKLPHLFQAAGLEDIRFDILPDRAFCGFGGDPERTWNWQTQWAAARPFSVKVFGGEAEADAAERRVMARLSDPKVFSYTTLFYVDGRVPGG